jgi:AraC-like DNA-binding protein
MLLDAGVSVALERDKGGVRLAVRSASMSARIGPGRVVGVETSARLNARSSAFPVGVNSAHDSRRETVRAVLVVLDERWHDPSLCLKYVAAEVGRSEWEVSRALVRSTGQGFREHLRRRRVAAARQQLASGDLPLKVIATHAGFSTPSQFTRQFLREEGMTPTQFRNETRSGKKGKVIRVA